jgi:membrane fusion protein, heavy metal efflux system
MKTKSTGRILLLARPRGFPRAAALAVIAVAAVASLAACSPKSGADRQSSSALAGEVTLTDAQREHIKLYTVALSKFRRTVETTGAVDFDNDQATSVLAPFSGPVLRILVSPGEKVKKGAPLALVDSPDFAEATTTYRKALSTATTLRRLADMDKDLVQRNGVSQREATQAETDAVSAEADRDAALQALVSLNVDPGTIKAVRDGRALSHIGGVIRSPISGTVAEKLITPGELLQAGTTPCFTVADLSRVWVMAQVFGSDLTSVAVGDEVEVETGVDSGKFSGRVDNISALVNPDTRSVVARVVVDNPGDLLKKQMYVHVRIQSSRERTGLLVPVSAILRDDENLPFVYVLQPDSSFARQHVTLGYRTGDLFEIPDGIKIGERIVIDGAIFVQFMQNQ